ncbi:MAG: ATPase, partial [Pseudomonadales bacterium]|nr:ATPase [Pseudomonadales bacterium]
MSFSLAQIFAMGVAYLSFFFLVAYFTELGFIPAKFVRHPAVYVLSLGVFASSWAIYGAIGFASDYGYNFLAYYLGISGAFMLAPILLAPILRLVKNYQLGSLADLLAFRYRSRTVGAAVTICMLFGIMPLLAMQIQAVADSIHVLNQETSPDILAFGFCVIITLFAVLFGARHISNREKHEGLVIAIAFESLIKLVAMATIAIFVLFAVFDGPSGLNDWLMYNPDATDRLYQPLKEGPWRSIIAAFFVAAVTTPHMFHMAFTENLNPRALLTASWGVPLYLFVLAISIPIILWGANVVQPETTAEYFTLGLPLALNNEALAILAFIAGLSAASGVIIVCTLALSAMCLNHIVVPLSPMNTQRNLYSWLLWSRRALIAAIIITSYCFYFALTKRHSLSELGFLTFVATTQFVPGLLGVLFWATANRRGFLYGLYAGMTIWTFGLLFPLILNYQIDVNIPFIIHDVFPTRENSYLVATFALFTNAMVFGLVSIMTDATPSEKLAAETCNVDNLRRSYRWELSVNSAREFIDHLKEPLGPSTAKREVQLALHDLAMSIDETRPYALRRLRDQLETNLSGLLGPSVAHDIIDQAIPYMIHSEESAIQDI